MLEAINKIQAAILSGYDSPTEVWADDICSSMGALLGTDHVYFLSRKSRLISLVRKAWASIAGRWGKPSQTASHFEGFDDDGFSLLRSLALMEPCCF